MDSITDRQVRWVATSQSCLDRELQRLRLLLQRRILWKCHGVQRPAPDGESNGHADWPWPEDDAGAEERFYREDPDAAALGRSLAETERILSEMAASLIRAGTPSRLELLTGLFGLTPFELNVLLLCLAPEIDPSFERLFALAQSDSARCYPTLNLAQMLFGREHDDVVSARESFSPEGALRRHRFVIQEPGLVSTTALSSRPLRIDERIADYLCGIDRVDAQIADLLCPLPALPLTPAQSELVERLALLFESEAARPQRPLINLLGPAESGREAVAQAVAEQIGYQACELRLDQLPACNPERHELLRLVEREALLSRMVLYVDARTPSPALHDLVERVNVFLLLGSEERWPTERAATTVAAPRPDPRARRSLWHQKLASLNHAVLDGQVEALARRFDFGPRDVAESVDEAARRARLRAPEADGRIASDDLWEAARERAGAPLEQLTERLAVRHEWQDLVLPREQIAQLETITAYLEHGPQVYDVWGFGARLEGERGIAALFSGPPGTGKTLAAEVLAGRLNTDLHRVDAAAFLGRSISETKADLERLFRVANAGGPVLLFDAAEALFSRWAIENNRPERRANAGLRLLLHYMESYRGLAILKVHHKDSLERGLLQRLSFQIDFPFPCAESRGRLWRRVFPLRSDVGELDYTTLAAMELSGGQIRATAIQAAFLAAAERASISMRHILQASQRESAKTERESTAADSNRFDRGQKDAESALKVRTSLAQMF
jgi:hypothetical protein